MTQKPTQKEIICKLLSEDPHKWWFTYELQKVNTKYGWLGTQGDRRARELREEGRLQSEGDGKYEKFKWKTMTVKKTVYEPRWIDGEYKAVAVEKEYTI